MLFMIPIVWFLYILGSGMEAGRKARILRNKATDEQMNAYFGKQKVQRELKSMIPIGKVRLE